MASLIPVLHSRMHTRLQSLEPHTGKSLTCNIPLLKACVGLSKGLGCQGTGIDSVQMDR